MASGSASKEAGPAADRLCVALPASAGQPGAGKVFASIGVVDVSAASGAALPDVVAAASPFGAG